MMITESGTESIQNVDKFELGRIIVKKAMQIFVKKNGK
jgi:hypothetical protein